MLQAVIRVRFPDNHTLEATFHPSEKIHGLVDLLTKVIAQPQLPFYLCKHFSSKVSMLYMCYIDIFLFLWNRDWHMEMLQILPLLKSRWKTCHRIFTLLALFPGQLCILHMIYQQVSICFLKFWFELKCVWFLYISCVTIPFVWAISSKILTGSFFPEIF